MTERFDKQIELEGKQTEASVIRLDNYKNYKDSQKLYCATCSVTCYSRTFYEAHLNGKKHRENIEQLKKQQQQVECDEPKKQKSPGKPKKQRSPAKANPSPTKAPVNGPTKHCDICNIDVTAKNWARHIKKPSHLNKVNHIEHKCDVCKKTFNTEKSFERHRKSISHKKTPKEQ